MLYALYIAKMIHIVAAAVWFGHKILLPRDLRSSLQAGGDQARGLIPRIERAERLGMASGLLTLFSGFAMILLSGGFAAMPLRIYIGMSLVIVMFLLGAIIARPAWSQVKRGIETEELEASRFGARRLIRVFVIEQSLWAAVLVTMVVKF